MKKILVLTFLLFPTVTYAAWWNPFTWSNKTELKANVIETVQPIPTPVVIEATSTPVVEKVVEKIVEKVVEKPVEKVVTKTVTVDNPSIVSELESLKKKYSELEVKYKQAQVKIAELTTDLIDARRSKTFTNNVTNVAGGSAQTLNTGAVKQPIVSVTDVSYEDGILRFTIDNNSENTIYFAKNSNISLGTKVSISLFCPQYVGTTDDMFITPPYAKSGCSVKTNEGPTRLFYSNDPKNTLNDLGVNLK